MDNDSSQNNLTEEKPVSTCLDFNPYQTNLQCETPGVIKEPPLTDGFQEDQKDQDSSETFSKITTLNQQPSEEATIDGWEKTDNERQRVSVNAFIPNENSSEAVGSIEEEQKEDEESVPAINTILI